MSTLSDARFDALRGQGFTGATSDMLLQWLQANGATSDAIPDAWEEMLTSNGYPYGQRNDSWYAMLASLGFDTGAMNDREKAFWEAGGIITDGGVRITTQPASHSDLERSTAVFTVVATSGDASPLTYQWQENVGGTWQNVSDGGKFSGTSTASMTFGPVDIEDVGRRFRVQVCNDVNCIFSQQALIQPLTGAWWFIMDENGNRIFDETPGNTNETIDERSEDDPWPG